MSLAVSGWKPEDTLGGAHRTRAWLTWFPLALYPILNEIWSCIDNASGREVSIAIPPLSWVDIHPELANNIVNFDDVFQFILAYKGDPYPFADPTACP